MCSDAVEIESNTCFTILGTIPELLFSFYYIYPSIVCVFPDEV